MCIRYYRIITKKHWSFFTWKKKHTVWNCNSTSKYMQCTCICMYMYTPSYMHIYSRTNACFFFKPIDTRNKTVFAPNTRSVCFVLCKKHESL